MAKIDPEMFAQFQAFQAFMANQQASTKPVDSKSARLATKDQKILRGFARKGIKNVVLMDRSDKAKPYNVKPFKVWFAEGLVVKRGEHGVQGLFHVSQVEPLKKEQPKVARPKLSLPNKASNDNQPSA